MRKTTPMSFGDLWEDFLRSSPGVARNLAAARVPEVWEGIVGPLVASHTTSITVEKGVMYVKFDSAAARNEIFMRREELKDAVNRAVGQKVVNVVIVK